MTFSCASAASGLRLAPEPVEVCGRREDLQRDGAVERVVVRPPDLRHRAVALQLVEPVAPGDFVSGSHELRYALTVASLLTLEEAQERVLKRRPAAPAGDACRSPTAGGRVSAEDVRARVDLPPFASSAMDGFAVRAADLPGTLRIVGESAAGARSTAQLEPGCAVAISTGAVVPEGADAVVPIENVVRTRQQSGDLAGGPARGAHPPSRRRRRRRRGGGPGRCEAHARTPRSRRGVRRRRALVRASSARCRARHRQRARRPRRRAPSGPDLRDERPHALRPRWPPPARRS